MKKLLLISVLAAFVCTDVVAQEVQEVQKAQEAPVSPVVTAEGTQTAASGYAQTRLRRRDRIQVRIGHELRFGVGAYGVGYTILGYTGCYEPPHSWNDRNYSLGTFEQSKIYSGDEYYSGVYSLDYAYRFNRTISFGVSFNYACVTTKYHNLSDDSRAGGINRHYMSVMPMLRAYWLNSKYVCLYSALGLGVTVERTVEQIGNRSYLNVDTLFAGQFTPLGITVGKRLYGFAEFGVGTQGVVIGGIGYKF